MNNGDDKRGRLRPLIGAILFAISMLGSLALSIWLLSQDRIWPGVGWAIIAVVMTFFFCLALYRFLGERGGKTKKSRHQ
jgi:hypothetical protein